MMPLLHLFKSSREIGDVDPLNEPLLCREPPHFATTAAPSMASNDVIPSSSNNSSRLYAQYLRHVVYLGEVYAE